MAQQSGVATIPTRKRGTSRRTGAYIPGYTREQGGYQPDLTYLEPVPCTQVAHINEQIRRMEEEARRGLAVSIVRTGSRGAQQPAQARRGGGGTQRGRAFARSLTAA
jgi:hypothetical protein